jgi:hypothetical protein
MQHDRARWADGGARLRLLPGAQAGESHTLNVSNFRLRLSLSYGRVQIPRGGQLARGNHGHFHDMQRSITRAQCGAISPPQGWG